MLLSLRLIACFYGSTAVSRRRCLVARFASMIFALDYWRVRRDATPAFSILAYPVKVYSLRCSTDR